MTQFREELSALQWIVPDSPLVLLPVEHRIDWWGSFKPTGDEGEVIYRLPDGTGLAVAEDSTGTHYEMVLEMEGDWEAVDYEGHPALIFNSAPLRTTWLTYADGSGVLIVRWQYAPSKEEGLQALAGGVPDDGWSGNGDFVVETSQWIFQPAVEPGVAAGSISELSVEIPPGSYALESYELKPKPKTWLRLYRLRRTINDVSWVAKGS